MVLRHSSFAFLLPLGLALSVAAPASAQPDLAARPLPIEHADPGPAAAGESAAEAPSEVDPRILEAQERNRVAEVHRAFGIATWISMTATVIFGGIQLRDEYGPFSGSEAQTPCNSGGVLLSQDLCDGFSWPHGVSAGITTLLYASTFTLSLFMPDPYDLASQDNPVGARLRTHKILRWLHFGGMIAQILLGSVVGLALDDDFGTRQALANVHFGLGMFTYGTLTAAAALMTF